MKRSWDEFVPEARVLKLNEAGMQKQKELIKANSKQEKAQSKKGRRPKTKKDEEEDMGDKPLPESEKEMEPPPSKDTRRAPKRGKGSNSTEQQLQQPATPEPQSGNKKNKRSRPDATIETAEHFQNKIEVKVKIPEELKPWLVDDWDFITRQKQLVTLPSRITVQSVLDEYIQYRVEKDDSVKDVVTELALGIKDYFNAMLGSQLLYKFERPQYSEILAEHPDKPMTDLYGPTHLLRLFVKLGGMLAYTKIDDRSMQTLLNHLNDFTKYMYTNSLTLFNTNDYTVAPPDYHRKAL